MSSNPAPEYNPYAPPKAMPPVQMYQQQPFQGPDPSFGLFRQGNILVMHKNCPLPDRCVKSNLPANGRTLKRTLRWHNPLAYLALLANVLIYIIVAAILTKTATIQIGLSEAWFAKRRMRIAIAWGLALLGMVMFIGGIIATNEPQSAVGPIAMMAGVFVFLFGAIFGLIGARLVSPSKMTDTHIWLKGVHPDYLAEFPHWPFG